MFDRLSGGEGSRYSLSRIFEEVAASTLFFLRSKDWLMDPSEGGGEFRESLRERVAEGLVRFFRESIEY